MENGNQLRLLYLWKILYEQTDENHFLTTNQLITILRDTYGIDCHRVTLKGDIALLQKYGLDIQEIKSRQNRYNLVSREFELPELKLLLDAVASSRFITRKKSEELTAKLCKFCSRYEVAKLKRNLITDGHVKMGNEKIYLIVDTINEAINEKRKISFPYFRYNARKELELKNDGAPYTVTPACILWSNDNYYLLGLYDGRDGINCFRVDRIAGVPQILEEPGILPENFDPSDYLSTTFRMFNGERTIVKLNCDNDMMDAVIDQFGSDVTTYAADDRSFYVIAHVSVSSVFYRWVFGFSGKVRIVEPPEVREGYMNMLKAAVSGMESQEEIP